MAISSTYFIHLDFFVVGKDLYCLPSNANPSQAMLTEGMKEDGNAWTRVVRNNNLHPDVPTQQQACAVLLRIAGGGTK